LFYQFEGSLIFRSFDINRIDKLNDKFKNLLIQKNEMDSGAWDKAWRPAGWTLGQGGCLCALGQVVASKPSRKRHATAAQE